MRARTIREQPTEPPPPPDLTESAVATDVAAFHALDDHVRRLELLAPLLDAGTVPPAAALRVAVASLGSLAAAADVARVPAVAEVARALRATLGRLGLGRPITSADRLVDTLVFDETVEHRELVALAVEMRGHPVRCVGTFDDFARALTERRPGLVVAEVELAHATPTNVCAVLCDLLGEAAVPFVLYSDIESGELADLAYMYGARRGVPKRLGAAVLASELEEVYRQILEARGLAGRT